MFEWLEGTPLAMWVSLSLWAYPALLSAHIVGLSTAVGIYVMRDLSCLGLVSGFSITGAAFRRLHRLALIGLLINVISGFLLFTSQASLLVTNTPFLIKMACVVSASLIAIRLQARLVVEEEATTGLKGLAAGSLLLWMSAIVAGRLIAYWG